MSETLTCTLRMPDADKFYEFITANARHGYPMVERDCRKGQSVEIFGAGPSLHRALFEDAEYADERWACNSALPFMENADLHVTHGFCIDQGEDMLREWSTLYDVDYLIATSVNPKLLDHLSGRRVTLFHNYLGIADPKDWNPEAHNMPPGTAYEMYLYRTLYKTSVQVGHGLNSVPRAICLALVMGFDHITVYGADCACQPDSPPMPEHGTPEYEQWMRELVMYADGRTASVYGTDAVMAEAVIDGVRWHTRPDMVVSARMMLDLEEVYPGRITLVGQTLPNAFRGKPPEFFANLPRLGGDGSVVNFGYATPPTMEQVA